MCIVVSILSSHLNHSTVLVHIQFIKEACLLVTSNWDAALLSPDVMCTH